MFENSRLVLDLGGLLFHLRPAYDQHDNRNFLTAPGGLIRQSLLRPIL
jgi:hypothetical protein